MGFYHPQIKLLRPVERANFPFSNSIFIDDEVKVLIDLGAGASNYQSIATKVDLVLLTHHHIDHIHGWPLFNDGRILVGAEEEFIYRDPALYFDSDGYSNWERIMGEEYDGGYFGGDLDDPEVLGPNSYPAGLKIGDRFRDGQVFDCGRVRFQALHLPGHTIGHYGFYFPDQDLIFSADYDLAPFGPWFGGSYCDYGGVVNSLQRIVDLQPKFLFGSHRYKVYEAIAEHLSQYMKIPRERQTRIMETLAGGPHSLKELLELIPTGFFEDQYEIFWERMMVWRQLNYLVEQGQLFQEKDLYQRL